MKNDEIILNIKSPVLFSASGQPDRIIQIKMSRQNWEDQGNLKWHLIAGHINTELGFGPDDVFKLRSDDIKKAYSESDANGNPVLQIEIFPTIQREDDRNLPGAERKIIGHQKEIVPKPGLAGEMGETETINMPIYVNDEDNEPNSLPLK